MRFAVLPPATWLSVRHHPSEQETRRSVQPGRSISGDFILSVYIGNACRKGRYGVFCNALLRVHLLSPAPLRNSPHPSAPHSSRRGPNPTVSPVRRYSTRQQRARWVGIRPRSQCVCAPNTPRTHPLVRDRPRLSGRSSAVSHLRRSARPGSSSIENGRRRYGATPAVGTAGRPSDFWMSS